jgi:hypothetical protein
MTTPEEWQAKQQAAEAGSAGRTLGSPGPLYPCRACNHRVAGDAQVCPSCGTSLPWKSRLQIDAEQKRGSLVGYIIVGILLLGMGSCTIWTLNHPEFQEEMARNRR